MNKSGKVCYDKTIDGVVLEADDGYEFRYDADYVANSRPNIKLRDFDALGQLLRIPDKARVNSYNKFQSSQKSVRQLINVSFLDNERKTGYWEIWNQKQKIFM